MAIRKFGVVGCGLMGSGIAQTCAQMGYETIVLEVTQPLLDKGIARIYGAWEMIASKGKLTSGQVEENHSRLHGTLNLEDFVDCTRLRHCCAVWSSLACTVRKVVKVFTRINKQEQAAMD